MTSKRVEIPLPSHSSDGSVMVHPATSSVYIRQPSGQHHEFLLEKVTKLWLERQKGVVLTAGLTYIFKEWPSGYAAFIRKRSEDRVDRYIFGHPNGGRYDSPIKFFKHFEYLTDRTKSCECILCTASEIPAKRKSRGHLVNSDLQPADKRMKPTVNGGRFKENYEPQHPKRISYVHNGSIHDSDLHLPRVGEIVIFSPHGKFRLHPETAQIEAVSDDGVHQSEWRAGRVLEVLKGKLKIETDLQPWNETNFDPNTIDINLNQQLPVSIYHEVLKSTPCREWHPSVRQALRLMASMHIITEGYTKRYPAGKIEVMVDGMIIGGERIRCGDCVRILAHPTSDEVAGVLLVGWIVITLKPNGQLDTSQKGTPKIFVCGDIFYPEECPESREDPLDPTEYSMMPIPLRGQRLYPNRMGSPDLSDDRYPVMLPADLVLDRMRGTESFLDMFDLREALGAQGVVDARLGKQTVGGKGRNSRDKASQISWTVTNHIPPSLRGSGEADVTSDVDRESVDHENDLNGFISTLLS